MSGESNLKDLATEIMDAKPHATPEAENIIAQAQAEAAQNLGDIPPGMFPDPEVTGNGNPMVDSGGNEWSADTHLTPPTKTKQGLWMRKRGIKPGTKIGGVQQVSVTPVNPLDSECRKAAESMVGKIFILGRAIGGDEWAPIKDDANGLDEKAQMTEAVFDFMKDSGKAWKLPSWLALPIVVFSYGAIRLMNLEHFPKTKTRWESFRGWFGRKFLGEE